MLAGGRPARVVGATPSLLEGNGRASGRSFAFGAPVSCWVVGRAACPWLAPPAQGALWARMLYLNKVLWLSQKNPRGAGTYNVSPSGL